MVPKILPVAYFITPHGFGHAARSAAVMQAMLDLNPDLFFHLFTTVPGWLFSDSIPSRYQIHPVECDIGLVQNGPMEEDLPATLDRLGQFLPIRRELVRDLSLQLLDLGCRLVLCDIAPLGILAARQAGLPCVLIENFTWDWIYAGYQTDFAAFLPHIRYLEETFALAGGHIQCEPLCARSEHATLVPPVSRKITSNRRDVRRRLGLPVDDPVVLISMGGIRMDSLRLDSLLQARKVTFVIPGGSDQTGHRENLVLLPWRGPVAHPDLLSACDAVVGKTGYSTVAEAYYAGIPYGFLNRPRFRESPVLAEFIQRRMHGVEIPRQAFRDGSWTALLSQLLALPRIQRNETNGSILAAAWITSLS